MELSKKLELELQTKVVKFSKNSEGVLQGFVEYDDCLNYCKKAKQESDNYKQGYQDATIKFCREIEKIYNDRMNHFFIKETLEYIAKTKDSIIDKLEKENGTN